MVLFNKETGVAEEVADPNSAVMQGTHELDKSALVRVSNPSDGSVYEVDAPTAAELLGLGGRIQSPEEQKSLELQEKFGDAPITASVLGAARSLSLGTTDIAANALGYAEEVRAIKELNPIASTTGEVGGIVIPMLLSGGTSGIAQLAKGSTALTRGVGATAKSLGAKLAGKGLGGKVAEAALEGAAYGAGTSISEAALGQPEHVAENLLIGGGLGALLPIAGAALKKTAKFGIEKALPAVEGLFDRDNAQLIKDLHRLSPEAAAKRTILTDYATKDARNNLRSSLVNIGETNAELGRIGKELFEGTKLANVDTFVANIPRAQIDELGVAPVQAEILKTLEGLQARPALYGRAPASALQETFEVLSKRTANAKNNGEVFRAINEAKQEISKHTSFPKGSAATPEQMRAAEPLNELYRRIADSLENANVWGKAGTTQQKLNSSFSEFASAQTDFNRAFTTRGQFSTKKFLSMLDQKDPVKSKPLMEIWNRYLGTSNKMREQLMHFGSDQLDNIAMRKDGIKKFGDELEKLSLIRKVDEMKSPLAPIAMVFGRVGIPINKIVPGPQQSIKILAMAEKQAARLNDTWVGEMAKTFGSLSAPVTAKAGTAVAPLFRDNEEADALMGHVAELAENAPKLTELAEMKIGPLYEVAPKVAQASLDQSINTVYYLASKLPADTANPPVLGLSRPGPRFADSEIAKWSRHYAAAVDPMRLLKEIQTGTVAPETVETVSVLYPNFYEKTRQGVLQYLGEKKPKLPYNKRQSLEMALGISVDESIQQPNLMAYQSTFLEQTQQQPTAQPSGKAPTGLGQAMLTKGQSLTTR